MSLPAGTVVAGYTIERTLGSGGMGTVYLARHPTLPRSDALKVLSAELSADPEFRARFRREADLASSLDHPNIVRVYTRGETEDGRLWIAMQVVDGTDAGKALDEGPLPMERTTHIITEVAKALDYAHSRGLLHRDIKPANFLLSGAPGPYERVLLADFGIARAVDDASQLTATGSMMTTVAYASPESVEGKPLDYRSDLYSLGCALFRMLTNRTPYQGAGAMSAVLMAHIMRPPPKATEFAPWLPPAIDDVIAKAMAKDPAQRYQSAREMADATTIALSGGQLPAHAPGTAEHTMNYPSGAFSGPFNAGEKGSKRRWILVGAVVATVLAVVAGFLLIPRGGEELGPYAAQNFGHTFGSTKIEQRPTDIATLSIADADTALSLGTPVVALSVPGGTVPSWLSDSAGSARVLAGSDNTGLADSHPKLIIDTDSALGQQGYDALAKIAPTVTRPNSSQAFDSQAQVTWLGDVLGRQQKAKELRDEMVQSLAKLASDHAAFKDKVVNVFYFTDSGLSVALPESSAASYLTGLGFSYSTDGGTGAGQDELPVQAKSLYSYSSADITLVVRSDKGAANGGFDGLPSAFEVMHGSVVVIDDPNLVAGLRSGGPAATRYLNSNLVGILAQHVH